MVVSFWHSLLLNYLSWFYFHKLRIDSDDFTMSLMYSRPTTQVAKEMQVLEPSLRSTGLQYAL